VSEPKIRVGEYIVNFSGICSKLAPDLSIVGEDVERSLAGHAAPAELYPARAFADPTRGGAG
jgi:hypothetical protein